MDSFPSLPDGFPDRNGFCRPDWTAIREHIEASVPPHEWPAAWEEAARRWVERLRGQMGEQYKVHETPNFLLLTDAPARIVAEASRFYERARSKILHALPGIALTEYFGKHVVLMFAQPDEYYLYIAGFYPDADMHPMSSGVCLSGDGYTHFAFPNFDHANYRGVLVHELTHFFVSHLPLPTWLNEALAMRMENLISESAPLRLDRDIFEQHAAHWDAETIQQFWSGESWQIAGDSNELSYSLAQILWRKIEVDLRPDKTAFLRFIGAAHRQDAGESAFIETFDESLGNLVGEFLGDGNWAPDPVAWGMKLSADAAAWQPPEATPAPPPLTWEMGAPATEGGPPFTWSESSGDAR